MTQNAVVRSNRLSPIKPEKLEVEPGADPSRIATIVIEPLERGFGMTLGNAIRRILLSSLQGAAVTAVRIDGVPHQFSRIPNVREEVTDIVLNIKQLALRMHGEGPKRMTLTATGPGEVRAGQIQAGNDIDIMNPRMLICTLDEGAKLGMTFTVNLGKGYQRSSDHGPEEAPIGWIALDSIYSPVHRASYRVDPTRVGQVTDYDRLLLTVETNGTVTPEAAVSQAAHILIGVATTAHTLIEDAIKTRAIHDDDSVFDDADALLALAQNAFTRAAKEEVAKNDSLNIPTHGSHNGRLVVRQPPKRRSLAQH
jgi:DNA-directed RNA polymerase subunit alpha